MAPSFAASYEATPGSIAKVRNQMAALARKCGLDDRTIDDVRIAVSEAVSNVLLHAYRGRRGEFHVKADVADGELVIAIGDDGDGMRPRPDSPGLGLGLPVIASLVNRLEICDDAPGTELRMAFDCAPTGFIPAGARLPAAP